MKLLLYYHTLKYLKLIQIRYQFWYKLRNKWRRITRFQYNYTKKVPKFEVLNFAKSIGNYTTYNGGCTFEFLNLVQDFKNEINWDFPEYGKLWTYNLNYFEYLNQHGNKKFHADFIYILKQYSLDLPKLINGNEPFPTALRIINWVKYFLENKVSDKDLIQSLYCQLYILDDNKEYHLLGNHLLENGFALMMGGLFFQDKYIYSQGKQILYNELNEQVLGDGAHFELSAMYHCLMLYRLLDVVNLLQTNDDTLSQSLGSQTEFTAFLVSKATNMCGWLNAIVYDNGDIVHFNDSTDGIAPRSNELFDYAQRLSVQYSQNRLMDSGYRRLKNNKIDAILKTGKIGPDYIPGHAHADSLTFECRINGVPFIVDTGISTYEKNVRRQVERSTFSHNTVSIENTNSSQVWGGFRVGKRAKSEVSNETETFVQSWHNGYDELCTRAWRLESDSLIIFDQLPNHSGEAHFHFYPEQPIELNTKGFVCGAIKVDFEGANTFEVYPYEYAWGFNKRTLAKKLIVKFSNQLKTIVSIENTVSNG